MYIDIQIYRQINIYMYIDDVILLDRKIYKSVCVMTMIGTVNRRNIQTLYTRIVQTSSIQRRERKMENYTSNRLIRLLTTFEKIDRQLASALNRSVNKEISCLKIWIIQNKFVGMYLFHVINFRMKLFLTEFEIMERKLMHNVQTDSII